MLINSSYVSGVLDTCGGFYKYQNKHLYFKIRLKNEKIMSIIYLYLKNKLKINIRPYKDIYYITNGDGVLKLVHFMKKHCLRDDYNQYI